MERLLVEVHGTVQGVGFRPYVYSLATALGLRGFAQNRGAHLFIDVEGEPDALRAFVQTVAAKPPTHAVVDEVTSCPVSPAGWQIFSIAASQDTQTDVQVSPDLATCEACLRELFDPADRRYRYPFITCSQCGPRYTIVTGVPYDRPNTTMRAFVMCEECRCEYEDPADRRFHAQPIACPTCGPVLKFQRAGRATVDGAEALDLAARALLAGEIVAVKGLGGYHLACDATDGAAVGRLRKRKGRDAKPFAVMARSAFARLPEALSALASPAAPIVLVERHALRLPVAETVAPDCPTLGVMRPYTPLHHLLLDATSRPLVMTSGNISDEPIACDDTDAWRRLGSIADAFLFHDRPIQSRCDDSVVRIVAGAATPLRRSRGYAPAPLQLAEEAPSPVLAVGGHLKNTFCIHAGKHVWMSAHIGDLSSAAAYVSLGESIARAATFLHVTPEVLAHDLHPGYLSTRLAEHYPVDRRIAVQHHHAHVLSCAAEHGLTGPVLGVVFDGSGLGSDGSIWGGEFLLADGPGFRRLAHLSCVPLAGGEAAVREPWRVAAAHLVAARHERMLEALERRIGRSRFRPVRRIVEGLVAAPRTSSVGRLFDAVASIAGVRDVAAFEGQAAMQLEAIASAGRRYEFAVNRSGMPWTIDPTPLVGAVAEDTLAGVDTGAISGGFHDALATVVADVAAGLADMAGVRHVALTGGVFQNARLTTAAVDALSRRGVVPLVHRRVPCNDGGLALGQAVAAARVLRHEQLREEQTACA